MNKKELTLTLRHLDKKIAKSKNPTKAGVLLVDEKYLFPANVITWATNGKVPNNIIDKPERWERPVKYIFIPHAEENLFCYCAKYGTETWGRTLLMRWFPCYICARMIIQAGIAKLICEKPDLENAEFQEKWHFKEALEMLEESSVELEYLKQ